MPRLSADSVARFGRRVFEAYGVPPSDASLVSSELIRSHLMGYESHGVVRFMEYFNEIEAGRIVPGAKAKVVHDSGAAAVVDCGFNVGIVSAFVALEIGIEKVRQIGVAMVATKSCNHTGRLGAYPERAARLGYIAIAGAAIPERGHFVVPWGGTEGRLGTNPLAYAVPSMGDPVLSDFATSVLPEGKIRAARNRGSALPPGSVMDADGNETQDPSAFYGPPIGRLLPFGGPVGYKGYALGLLVELLGGALAGEKSRDPERPVNSLWLVLIDPDRFLPKGEYEARTAEVIQYMHSSKPVRPSDPVRVPGEAGFARLRAAGEDPYIELDDQTWSQLLEAGRRKGVDSAFAINSSDQ